MSVRLYRQPGFARAWRHMLLGLLMLLPLLAGAQSYMGKMCTVNTLTTREQGPVTPEVFVVELDVTNLGGTTYSVAGGLLAPPDEPMVVTGHATLVGNDLYFNMILTQVHADGWVDTSIHRTRLNLSTLTGTFHEIGNSYNRVSRSYEPMYSAGTVELSLSACQR